MPLDQPVPSTPDPSLVALATSLLRYVVTFLTAIGFVKGPYSDTVLGTAAYALVGCSMVVWSIVEKVKMARHAHDTAVLNAALPAGSLPVQPVV